MHADMNSFFLAAAAVTAVITTSWVASLKRLSRPPSIFLIATILVWLSCELATNFTQTLWQEQWLSAVRLMMSTYASIGLLTWLLLDLPKPLPWWPHPPKIARDLLALGLGSASTVVILQHEAKINVVGLVATSAILTAILGLAAQETLKDIFIGIMLRFDKPFEEGDYLEINNDINGWVLSSTLLSTRLKHVHGATISIPNSTIWSERVKIFRSDGPVAREIHIRLSRQYPPNQAEELLLNAAANSITVLKEPKPEAFVYEYNEYSVTYELEVWQSDPSDTGFDKLRGEIFGQLWYALERSDQKIPYPISEIILQKDSRAIFQKEDPQVKCLTALMENPILKYLDYDVLSEIAEKSRILRFGKGEVLIREGEEGDRMYQVVEGHLAVYKVDQDTQEINITTLKRNDIIGEMGVFSGKKRSANVKAIDECILLEIEREDISPVIHREPEILEVLAKIIQERQASLNAAGAATSKSAEKPSLLAAMRRIFKL